MRKGVPRSELAGRVRSLLADGVPRRFGDILAHVEAYISPEQAELARAASLRRSKQTGEPRSDPRATVLRRCLRSIGAVEVGLSYARAGVDARFCLARPRRVELDDASVTGRLRSLLSDARPHTLAELIDAAAPAISDACALKYAEWNYRKGDLPPDALDIGRRVIVSHRLGQIGATKLPGWRFQLDPANLERGKQTSRSRKQASERAILPEPVQADSLTPALRTLLADGEPHTLGELLVRAGYLIRPELALRRIERKSKPSPRTSRYQHVRERSLSDTVDAGRRVIIQTALYHLGAHKVDEVAPGPLGVRYRLPKPVDLGEERNRRRIETQQSGARFGGDAARALADGRDGNGLGAEPRRRDIRTGESSGVPRRVAWAAARSSRL